MFANTLIKKPDKINKYFTNGNQLYLYGDNEICMLSLNSSKPVAYQMILNEVQKYNTSVIKIDVDTLKDLVKRTKAFKKAEDIFQSNSMPSIHMEVTNENLTLRTSVSEESVTVTNDDDFDIQIKVNVIASFFNAITNASFLRDAKTVELHVGKNMRLAYAVCGTTKVVGALWAC